MFSLIARRIVMQFTSKKPHYEYLRKKWIGRHKNIQNKLWEKHGTSLRQLAVGSLGGLMLLTTPPPGALITSHLLSSNHQITKDTDNNILLVAELAKQLPSEVGPLTQTEEEEISRILSNSFGFKVSVELDSIKLNRRYGLIGGEQHLYRYPGDTLYKHVDTTADWAMFGYSGIAPGLGAWGYFAPSEAQFSEKDKMREKYYLATQTFLAPGFAENVVKYRDFFKFRKMLVVNPKTGQSVVTVIGDAGPAEWTGKHLGGSPEVMHYLGLAQGSRKGAVLYFFIDDPEDQIPLGPIKASNFRS